MLTDAQLARRRGRRRATASPQQLYQEFLVHRIEAYKNSRSRQDLMQLAQDAVADQGATTEGQLFLTEVMMLDCVDRLISKRLKLPTFKTWKQHYGKLRAAQREPAYWGVSDDHPVAALLPRCEAGDRALLVGAATERLVPLLAAHDVEVTFLAGSLPVVERVEKRTAEESLAGAFEAFVVQLGRRWLPPSEHPMQIVVLDSREVGMLAEPDLRDFIGSLQDRSAAVGVHVLLGHAGGIAELRAWYAGWRHLPADEHGSVLIPPTCQNDSDASESLQHTLLDARD
ncbi:MAG TPA: hypothetical protein VGR60_03545 [Gemmatimonadales bacterium]|nr:hypothetical protein [Gemmatimonadales bacterium]